VSRALLVAVITAFPIAAGAVTTRETVSQPLPGEKIIDPDADRMLKAMATYLSSLQSFRVMTSSANEIVTKKGQKIQIATDDVVTVERPNKLRSEHVGATRSGISYWDDGKSMTLYCKAEGTYATLDAPPTIDETMEEVRKRFQIEQPVADLLSNRPYQTLTEQVTGGQFVGRESVDGVAANHLAFTGREADRQIWIQEGPEPLPLRYVVTSKTLPSQPQTTVRLSQWETHPAIPESTFVFQAPPGSERVSAFPEPCGTRAQHDSGVPNNEYR
jgi:hypothetical protein